MMVIKLKTLKSFRKKSTQVARIRVSDIKGSTPREVGAWMLVSPDKTLGTIGGGQLEFRATERARKLLQFQEKAAALDIPLGPEIGQCCGGRVALDVMRVDDVEWHEIESDVEQMRLNSPHIYLFGGGHVGTALAHALTLLPFRVFVVETRQEMLQDLPEDVEPILLPMPEAIIREAPPASAFVILTHDHALDFLITKEALLRDDAAYVGMIGSKTKKATFKHWFFENGGNDAMLARLVSPIGGCRVKDKRPEIIAALVTAELLSATLGYGA